MTGTPRSRARLNGRCGFQRFSSGRVNGRNRRSAAVDIARLEVRCAPIPAIRGTEIERQGSTPCGHSARRVKSRIRQGRGRGYADAQGNVEAT